MTPRGLSTSDAATYCGLKPSQFRAWIADGRLPGPIPGTRRFDRKAIDRALDNLSGLSDDTTPKTAYDAWKRVNA